MLEGNIIRNKLVQVWATYRLPNFAVRVENAVANGAFPAQAGLAALAEEFIMNSHNVSRRVAFDPVLEACGHDVPSVDIVLSQNL